MSLQQSTQQQQIRQSNCVSEHFVQVVHKFVGQSLALNLPSVDKVQNNAELVAYLHDPVKDVFIATKSIIQLNQNFKTANKKENSQKDCTLELARMRVHNLRKNIAAKLPQIKDIVEEMDDHQIEKVYREHIGGKGSRPKFKGFQSKPIISFSQRANSKIQEGKQRSLQIQDQKEQLTCSFKVKRTQKGIIKAAVPNPKIAIKTS